MSVNFIFLLIHKIRPIYMIHEPCIIGMYTIIEPTSAPKYITVSLLVFMQN
jgi:hypothetical protein